LPLAQGQDYAGADAVIGVAPDVLRGISARSVFMGAMSYIGNAPNFMVKSIAESAGVKCPSFGGYFDLGLRDPVADLLCRERALPRPASLVRG
jgi:hypothetical protein